MVSDEDDGVHGDAVLDGDDYHHHHHRVDPLAVEAVPASCATDIHMVVLDADRKGDHRTHRIVAVECNVNTWAE